jgi:protein O-GlcNAc transferase
MKKQVKEIVTLIENHELEKADLKLNSLINKKSSSAELMYIKAIIEKEKNNLNESENFLLRAIEYDPCNIYFKNELISIYILQNKNKLAIKELEELLLSHSNNIDLLLSLANAHAKLRNMVAAEDILKRILSLDPKNSIALYLLSISYFHQRKYPESVDTAILALKINPNLTYMRSIIADHYANREDKFLIALQLLHEEINLYPNSDSAYMMIGSVYSKLGEINKCLAYTQKQIEINPICSVSRNNYLMFSHYSPDLKPQDILKAAHDNYEFCLKQYDNKIGYNHSKRIKNKILKIGFVSGDLRNHALFFWLRQFFKELSYLEVETYYFCNNNEDNFSREIKESSKNWLNIQKFSDAEVAEKIHTENIDILFDLSGHTAKNRLNIFMYKPSPIQITWLGHPGPIGVPQIEYILVDNYLINETEEKNYTEKILRMPNSFAPYGTFENIKVKETPWKRNGYITFGCFNNFMKINPQVLESWMKIMHLIPKSRLFLKSHLFIDDNLIINYKKKFVDQGINSERIQLEPFSNNRNEYLDLYNEIDIALDPFPLGGGTTTHDLLFMSTPLIATRGNHMSHRISASILNNIGCKELIAKDKDDYIYKAIELAISPERIINYKKTLRDKYLNSSITNNKMFADNFLELCQTIFNRNLDN